jgi:hypothetical protein
LYSKATGGEFTGPARTKLREVAKSAGITLPKQLGPRTFQGRGEIAGTHDDPVPVASQADYDILEPGTYYTSNGKLHQKKGR